MPRESMPVRHLSKVGDVQPGDEMQGDGLRKRLYAVDEKICRAVEPPLPRADAPTASPTTKSEIPLVT
jgi:hypothetical protein